MVVHDDEVVLAGPKAAATLDQIANAVESMRPHEDDMFSPRSSAALTLTSIAMQPPPPQQALFSTLSSPLPETSIALSSSHLHDFQEDGDDDYMDDYFIDAKQAFQPPRETFVKKPINHMNIHSRSEQVKAEASKIRRVSVGGSMKQVDENNPALRISGNETEHPYLESSSKDSFATTPFSSIHHHHHHHGPHSFVPSVLVSSYTIGPCAFSVTRSNPPAATAADFLPPSWDTPRWTSDSRKHQSVAPSYTAVPNQWEGNSQEPPQHGKHPSNYNTKHSATNPPFYQSYCPPLFPQPKLNQLPFDPTTVTPTPSKKIRSDESNNDNSVDNTSEQATILPMADFQPSFNATSSLKTKSKGTFLLPVSESKGKQKKKTLGSLAESFIERYERIGKRKRDGSDADKERMIVIDDLAKDLEVERRRIYDVVNILESLQIVVKKGKNTYEWMGSEHLVRHFALLQNEAIQVWPHHAHEHGLLPQVPPAAAGRSDVDDGKETNKSLTRLSLQFLQVFLVGFTTVNLPQASDIIQGSASSQYELAVMGSAGKPVPKDPKRFNQAAARGLKTKIRRLYDVANVYLAIGLLRRTEDRSAVTVEGKRPHFHWNFASGVAEIRKIYEQLPDQMKAEQTPYCSYFESTASRKKPVTDTNAKDDQHLTSFVTSFRWSDGIDADESLPPSEP